MYDDGPLSTRQQLDALKLERERAKLLADQAKAQQQVQKLAEKSPVPPVRQGVPFKATALGPTPEQLAGEPYKQQAPFKVTALGPTPKELAGEPYKQQARSLQAPPTVQGVTDPYNYNEVRRYLEDNPVPGPDGKPVSPDWVINSMQTNPNPKSLRTTLNGMRDKGYNVYGEQGKANGVPPDFRLKTLDEIAPVVKAPLGNLTASDMAINTSGSPVVDSANIVRPNDTGSMRFDNAANDPRRTDVPPLAAAEIPPGTIMDARDAMAMQQPTGREVLIAKQDLANSTDRATRERAQSVLNRANDFGVQEQGPMPEVPKKDSRPTINEAVPVPSGIMDSELGNELGDVIPGETRQRKLTTEEAVSAVDERISKLDPNNPLDLRTIQELEKQKETLSEEAVARGEEPPKPEVKPEDLPDIQRNKFDQLGELGSQYEAEALKTSLMDTDFPGYTANAMQLKRLVDEGKEEEAASKINPSFWSKLSESFGSLFTDKEFIKFGILLAGGLLTGGSFGGSLKYAGLYALQSADKREEAERKSELELGKENIKAGATAKTARIKALSDEVKEGIKSGRFSVQNGDRILKVLNGRDGVLKAEALLSQDGIESAAYRAGVDPKSSVSVLTAGSMTPVMAYPNPKGEGYIQISSETDSEGVERTYSTLLPLNTTAITDKNRDQVENSVFNDMADKFISTAIEYDKNNEPINVDKGFSIKTINSQLKDWSDNQRRLGLNDDPSQYTEVIRVALKKAVDSGNRNPHVGNLLALAVINTESLVDPEKLKGVKSGYIGKAVEDINLAAGFKTNKEKEDFMSGLKGTSASKRKRLAKELNDRSTAFFDKVSYGYTSGKDKYDQDELADLYKSSAGKGINNTLYNKIKEAPNEWWGYVYYQIALEEKARKDAKPKKE